MQYQNAEGALNAVFGEVICDTFWCRFHCIFTWFPVGRTHIAMLFKKLQRIYDPKSLVDISAKGKVVHQFVADNPVLVNQKKAPERDPVFQQYPVIR